MEIAQRLFALDVLGALSKISEQVLWSIHNTTVNVIFKDDIILSYQLCRCFNEADDITPFGVAQVFIDKYTDIAVVYIGDDKYDIDEYVLGWKNHVLRNVLVPVEMLNNEYNIGKMASSIIAQKLVSEYKADIAKTQTMKFYVVGKELGLLVNTIEF